MQKVQGSVSGRKIKRNTSSAVWNTERKYNSTPHSYLHHLYHHSTADIGIADEETFRLIRSHLSVASCLVTLGEVGEVRGIVSATTVNSLVNSWAMTGTDSDSAAARIIRRHTRPTPLRLWLLKLINLCVAWLLRRNLHENSRCRGVLQHHPWWRERKRECKCTKAFVHIPRLGREFRWRLLEQHICRPIHYSRIHSGLTHAQDRLQISPTNS